MGCRLPPSIRGNNLCEFSPDERQDREKEDPSLEESDPPAPEDKKYSQGMALRCCGQDPSLPIAQLNFFSCPACAGNSCHFCLTWSSAFELDGAKGINAYQKV